MKHALPCSLSTCRRTTKDPSGRCQDHRNGVGGETARVRLPAPNPISGGVRPADAGILRDFGGALANGELRLAYQPKYDARTGEIVGAEALARWESPTRGTVSPDDFVPTVENSELAADFAVWSFTEAGAVLDRVDSRLPSLSVNLSARTLGEPGIGESLADAVRSSGGDPSRIVVEITETAAIDDWEAVLDEAATLRSAGFRLSVDDLGSGHATIEYVEALGPYEAKIDRSVVADGGVALTDLVARCRELKASVTAEGVEDAATAAALGRMGVDTFQGYHFSGPLEERAFAAAVRR